MKILAKTTALLLVLFAATALPATATDPAVYGSNTTYVGAGKHPKTGVSGLILDGKTQGATFVCYDYILITSDKIKGQITAVAERISGNNVEKIATFSKNNVQAFDFSQVPPGGDMCGAPDPEPGFNFGIASDCVQVNKALAKGDIVRWTFKFKKSSKLKGNNAIVQVSGSVLPFSALSNATDAQAEWLLSRIEGSGRDLISSRQGRR